MNDAQPARAGRPLRAGLPRHAARRARREDDDRGASAVELAVITAVLVALAVLILGIIVKFAKNQGDQHHQHQVPKPAAAATTGASERELRQTPEAARRRADHGRCADGLQVAQPLPGADRGASAVELAILAPALLFVSMLIIQFALWFDARHAALAAAQEGDLVAREDASLNQADWRQTARSRRDELLPRPGHERALGAGDRGGHDGPRGHRVGHVQRKAQRRSFPLTISETVTGPVECFRPGQPQSGRRADETRGDWGQAQRDRGSMAVEFVIAGPAFVLLLLLVGAGGQWVT